MLKCPVCGTENGDLETVCRSCKGFIQAKVDTLDLFSTVWGLMDQPSRTFRRIAIAKTKNYVIALSAGIGIALVYLYFWHWQMAVRMPSLVTLLGIGLLAGPPLGNLLIALGSVVIRFILRIRGVSLSFRSAFALLSYAGVPVVASLIAVMPVEIAVFGIFFFDNNPPPIVINPVAYIGLLGLDTLAGCWSIVWIVLGIRSATGASWVWSIIPALVVGALIALLVTGLRPF